jgi:hypothetical protein
MSGSTPTNTSAVDFEKQQAAQADAKEAARQASLQQGQTLIDQIFNGAPVMGTKTSNYDWSTFTPGAGLMPASGMPAGYTAVRIPGTTTATAAPAATSGGGASPQYAGSYNTGRYASPTVSSGASAAPAASAAPTWGLQDASGKIYKQGDPLSISSQYDTGQRTGGFDDAFYNNYKQKILDYYQPDEQKQYDEAQRNLTYNLARAGTLQSSVAGDKQGDLAYNDALQKANIVANANAQTGQLQTQIQSNKQDLINQLYATDDPTLTANLAESSAKASQLQNPTLTPAAALFTPALTAAGSVANYALNPNYLVQPGAGGPTSPTPTSSTSNAAGKVMSNW